MNKRLVRIISGAAIGAAASYLLLSRNRGLMNGVRELGSSLGDTLGNMMGGEESMANNTPAASANTAKSTRGRTQTKSTGTKAKSGSTTSRRG